MTPKATLDMALWSCIRLDDWTFSMTVVERWTERRWLGVETREQLKTYDLGIRVGRWLDGNRYVLPPDPRHFKLWELFGAWRIERRLDEYLGQREPSPVAVAPRTGPLPPVPVLPPRRLPSRAR